MLFIGISYTHLHGSDQNSMPIVERGNQLSLRWKVLRVGEPAVAACLGRRVVGRIHDDEARGYDGLIEELPHHQDQMEAIAVVSDIQHDHHRRRNGTRYQYTRINLEIKYWYWS